MTLVDQIALTIAQHFRGDKQTLDAPAAVALFGPCAEKVLSVVEKALAVRRTGAGLDLEIANDAPHPGAPNAPYPDYSVLKKLASGTTAIAGLPPVSIDSVPLRFPQTQKAAPGAVAGMPGWFWWEQVQPPGGVTIEYKSVGSKASHTIPSAQSPVSLAGKMWRQV